MRFLDYLTMRTDVPVDVDHAYGPQCTDLVNDYLRQVWGAPPLGGNAVDFQRGHIPGWPWTPNLPLNTPPTGAVLVWSGSSWFVGTGPAGHTAIALLADRYQLISLDQNWPTGHAPQQVRHSYVALAGWFAPPSPALAHG